MSPSRSSRVLSVPGPAPASAAPDSAPAALSAVAARSFQQPLLSVSDLRISVDSGTAEVVHGVSFDVPRGSSLGIVGESGSGKSLTCRAILGILPAGVVASGGEIRFKGVDLSTLGAREWQQVRGNSIAAVFQDPSSYLNPSIAVGKQLAEVLRVKLAVPRREAKPRAIELLRSLGLHNPAEVYGQYPHELSGGMLQRVLIAIAVSCDPDLLIADEATTALDVTVQAEVLDLLEDLRESRELTLVLVSHDLAVVAQVCDRVVVMKDGEIVEAGLTESVLRSPQHEYTRLLVRDHAEFGIERFAGGARVSA